MKIKWGLILLGFLIPYLLIYTAFFSSSPLAWGDAPYFFPENLDNLFQQPLAWDFRNNNFGASQLQVLWLYLPTFLFGLLHKFLGLNSWVLIRLIFYFPATILAILGAWSYIKKYTKNIWSIFLGTFLYSFNTYFLLVLDGGQIGVALAYGIFPWCLLVFQNLIDESNFKNRLLSILSFLVITNIDLRIAILVLITLLITNITRILVSRKWNDLMGVIFKIVQVSAVTLILDSFWLIPLLSSLQSGLNQIIGDSSSVSLLNSLLFFNPQFPKNEFGKIVAPPFYFGFLPLLIFGLLFFKESKKYFGLILSLLILIFLSKGEADPFGQPYSFLINNMPLANSFRDPSKFFPAILLIAGVLVALTSERLFTFKKRTLFFMLIFSYLILLIWPAFSRQLTGALGEAKFDQSYQVIYQNFKNNPQFFRSVWFPERPPLAFSSMNKEALSADLLYQDKAFAAQIVGSYDLTYFLHSNQLSDWFKLLGIKYAFFPESQRKKTYTEKERQERQQFVGFVDSLGFKKLNWPISFPGYEFMDPMPKIFGQQKAMVVIGDTSIYEKLAKIPGFSLSNQGFLFTEDGLFDPQQLIKLPIDSLLVVLNNANQIDLTLSFLQKYFLQNPNKTNWGFYPPSQYLESKYELLKNGISSDDLLFNKGLYFSTQKGEKIEYPIMTNAGKYRLAIRTISATNSSGLKINFNGERIVKNNQFTWDLIGPFDGSNKNEILTMENLGGFQAINTVALIPEQEFQLANQKAEEFLKNHQVVDVSDPNKIAGLLNDLKPIKIDYSEINTTEYKINVNDPKVHWLIFSDHYNSDWQLTGKTGFPMYSMINGFYINKPDKLDLYYQPQDLINLGLKIAVISSLIFVGVLMRRHFFMKNV